MEITTGQLKEMIGAEVTEALEPLMRKQQNRMKDLLSAARSQERPEREKGTRAARVMRALAAGRGDPQRAASFAEKAWDDDEVLKALAAGEATGGGFLLPEDISAEVIELLRPASVVRSLDPAVVPMVSGTLSIPKHTAGSSGGWIGENVNVPATRPTFGQVRLTARKYAALVPISNDLLRRASGAVDTMVRDDLVADIATATDLAFIRGDGNAGQPKGLKNWAGNSIAANATVNLTNVTNDLGTMIQTLLDNSVRMLRVGWIMEPRTWKELVTIRDGNGNLAYKPEMDSGTLFGFRFRVTTQIPRNLGAGNETELYLADFADVVIGEATQVLIDASGETAYHDGSQVVAAFSLDQTVIRAVVEVDLAVRHAESVVVLTGVTWGV